MLGKSVYHNNPLAQEQYNKDVMKEFKERQQKKKKLTEKKLNNNGLKHNNDDDLDMDMHMDMGMNIDELKHDNDNANKPKNNEPGNSNEPRNDDDMIDGNEDANEDANGDANEDINEDANEDKHNVYVGYIFGNYRLKSKCQWHPLRMMHYLQARGGFKESIQAIERYDVEHMKYDNLDYWETLKKAYCDFHSLNEIEVTYKSANEWFRNRCINKKRNIHNQHLFTPVSTDTIPIIIKKTYEMIYKIHNHFYKVCYT